MEEELEVDIQHKEEEEWEREETKCRAMRSRCSALFTQAGGRPVLLCPKCICATQCAPNACAKAQCHNVLIQGSVVVIRQFLIFINQTFLMVSVALVTMVD